MAAAAEEGCVVSLADSGTGIPARELRSIFERFRRLERSEGAGLGLGLCVSQWIVDAHGGRIRAEGNVGKVAAFFFTLR